MIKREEKLKEAERRDPSNAAAPYYMDLIKEARYMDAARIRENGTKTELLDVEKAWLLPTDHEHLPVPNPSATNNYSHSSPGRSEILRKLNEISLTELDYPGIDQGLSLTELMRGLGSRYGKTGFGKPRD